MKTAVAETWPELGEHPPVATQVLIVFLRAQLQTQHLNLTPLKARTGRLLWRGEDSPDHKAAGLCRELNQWWDALWTFTRVEGVEPT